CPAVPEPLPPVPALPAAPPPPSRTFPRSRLLLQLASTSRADAAPTISRRFMRPHPTFGLSRRRPSRNRLQRLVHHPAEDAAREAAVKARRDLAGLIEAFQPDQRLD